MRLKQLIVLSAVLFALTLPAFAESDIEYRGWGFRVGASSDPDQVVGGVQFDFGEFTENLRFQPDLQVGFGDDVTTIFATLPVHYRFNVDQDFTPYAGGGLAVGFVEIDLPPMSSGDDTSFEIGGRAVGGLEWNRSNGRSFALELGIGLGDVPDAQIVAIWNFGK